MNPFNTALIKAPQRSRFDFNHSNTVGLRVGVLTPTLTEFIVPGDEVSMSMEQIARLAPMPVPTFVSLKLRHDFFFVPLRLLYGNDPMDKLFGSEAASRKRAFLKNLGMVYSFGTNLVQRQNDYDNAASSVGGFPVPGCLADYLGFPVMTDRNGGLDASRLAAVADGDFDAFADSVNDNAANLAPILRNELDLCIEKFFAYHFIWRDWYRFTGIQDNTIVEPYLDNGVLAVWNDIGLGAYTANLSCDSLFSAFNTLVPFIQEGDLKLTFFDIFGRLRLAHLTKDMFTSVRFGNKPTVLIPTGSNGTIPALREASAVQRFLDIISITGQRYFDKVRGLFGVEPEGPKDDRVQFLARYQQFVKVGEVLTTATTDQGTTGDYAGRGVLIDGKYLFKRRFTEHGYLFCISSVIPDVAYNGLGRDITDVNVLDTPVPSLAQVGDQTVFNREVHFYFGLIGQGGNPNNMSFGDQFRYYAYKSHNNEVHGAFLMDTFSPWSPLLPFENPAYSPEITGTTNVIGASRVYPSRWNQIFNDSSDEYIFGDRFFLNLDFYESITRALPKYINYHL